MLVCDHCQTLGKPYKEDHPVPSRPRPTVSPKSNVRSPIILPVRRKTAELPREIDELDLADDFAERVRKHRTKLGISQDELARRVKQKLSVIQKIETGKITPDSRLCHELEHELKVKLLLPHDDDETESPKAAAPTSVTLGDIIQIKGKSKLDDSNSSS